MDTKYIVVMRTFTYDVEKIKTEWAENHDGAEPTDDDIFEMVEEWASEDMRQPLTRHSVVWMDDEGNEI